MPTNIKHQFKEAVKIKGEGAEAFRKATEELYCLMKESEEVHGVRYGSLVVSTKSRDIARDKNLWPETLGYGNSHYVTHYTGGGTISEQWELKPPIDTYIWLEGFAERTDHFKTGGKEEK